MATARFTDDNAVVRLEGALSGTIPASSVGGVTVSGTPTAGQVLTATSATAADWEAGGGGGGFSAVACAFGVVDVDCAMIGDHPLKPMGVVDNLFGFNPIGGIPVGMGLSVATDGSSSTWTATTSGVWSLMVVVNLPSDATWVANLGLNEIGFNTLLVPGLTGALGQTLEGVFTIPSGTTFTFSIVTLAAATGGTFIVASNSFSVVRLA